MVSKAIKASCRVKEGSAEHPHLLHLQNRYSEITKSIKNQRRTKRVMASITRLRQPLVLHEALQLVHLLSPNTSKGWRNSGLLLGKENLWVYSY
jgi:hypothetical protein